MIFPPLDVWRHLQAISAEFRVPEHSLHEHGLLALKPMYGFNDAPLAWQLSLRSFLMDDLGASRSKLDENSFAFKTANQDKIDNLVNLGAMITTHVDDLAVMMG